MTTRSTFLQQIAVAIGSLPFLSLLLPEALPEEEVLDIGGPLSDEVAGWWSLNGDDEMYHWKHGGPEEDDVRSFISNWNNLP